MIIKNKCNFSFEHYQEILELFKKRNYNFCFFAKKPNKTKKEVYLRHDVDLSLECALEMAKIEKNNNAQATYFIRFASPFYNVFNFEYINIIREIIDSGHEIGLHFEQEFNQRYKSLFEKEILLQFQVLSKYFKLKKFVTFHCPSPIIFNQKFKNFVNPYNHEFFTQIKYLSDSRGIWREGCVCQWLKRNTNQSFQVLMHPIWWGRNTKDSNKHLHQYLKEKTKYLDNSLSEEFKIYNG